MKSAILFSVILGSTWSLPFAIGSSSRSRDRDQHWAFRPIHRQKIPTVKHPGRARNPIDLFILKRLEKEGITPSVEADRATLIRRVTLDLIGLPPSVAEVDSFLNDPRPDAYERLVDRLLASPHYGERWARLWLDLCHYGDSDGYLTDQLRPFAWRYRHWLVDALNSDMPFDQFTIDQLAGDLLPNPTTEQLVATGFLRNTLSNREGGADLEEFRVEQVVDRVQMVSTAWLGLTMGCARCHDHKYDPIRQKEFFQLYAFFDSADEVNIDAPLEGETAYYAKRPEYDRKRAELLKPLEKDIAELQTRWEKRLLEAALNPGKDHVWDRQWEVLGLTWGGGLGEGQLEGTQIVMLDPLLRTEEQKSRLMDYFLESGSEIDSNRFTELNLGEVSKKLQQLKKELPQLTRAQTMQETRHLRQVYVHDRGDFRSRGDKVEPGTPDVLNPVLRASISDRRVNLKDKPDRLMLAKWLLSRENPLTRRVIVNRMWQEFFGRGLVLTSADFGTRGTAPTHPELLDWLALNFGAQNSGGCRWSMKALHKLIVTSATYRQSSKARHELVMRDPDNELLARQPSLRLCAEQVRDVALTASGLLNTKIGGPSVFPPQPDSVAMEGFRNTWVPSEGSERYRRGLYTFIQRLSPFAQNVTFDSPSPSRSCSRRERSNTPLQALTLLNDPVFFDAAQALAMRLLREASGNIDERLEYGFRLCLSRQPTTVEKTRLKTYYDRQVEILRKDPESAMKMFPHSIAGLDASDAGALVGVSSVLLNLHEFITRD